MKRRLITLLFLLSASVLLMHAMHGAAAPTPGFCTRLSQCLSACFRSSCCTREAPVAQAPAGAPVVAAVPVPAPVPVPAKAAAGAVPVPAAIIPAVLPLPAAVATPEQFKRDLAAAAAAAGPGPAIHAAQPAAEANNFTIEALPDGTITVTLTESNTSHLIGYASGRLAPHHKGFIDEIIINPPFEHNEAIFSEQLCLKICNEMSQRGCTQTTLSVQPASNILPYKRLDYLKTTLIPRYQALGFTLITMTMGALQPRAIMRINCMPLAHEASAAGAAAARPASLPYLTDTATGPTQRMCRFNTEIDSYGNIVISLVLADNPRDEIGHATGSILSGKAGLLEHLEVDPRHRGHRLGDILCNKMCQELYNLGCTAVELIAHPLEENPTGRTKEAFLQESLIPLYTRCGFVIAGEYPVASDRSFMVRNLSTAPVVPVPELFPYPPGKPPAAGAGPAAPIPVAAAVAAGAIL